MSDTLGRYLVSGTRVYRGHPPGTEFEARLTPNQEARAINRGSITLLSVVPNDLVPNSYRLPVGWAERRKGSE